MAPKLDWLQTRLDLDDLGLRKMVLAFPALLTYSVEDNMQPKLGKKVKKRRTRKLQFSRLSFLLMILAIPGVVKGFVVDVISVRRKKLISPRNRFHDRNLQHPLKPPHSRSRNNPLQATTAVASGLKLLHSNSSYVLSFVLWLSAFGISGGLLIENHHSFEKRFE